MPLSGDPVVASDVGDLADDSSLKPIVRLVQTVSQSIPNNAITPLTFSGVDVIDTHNFHDPSVNNSRITPTKAGYYRVSGSVWMNASLTYTNIRVGIRKNGTTMQAPAVGVGGLAFQGAPASAPTAQISGIPIGDVLIDMNGTTDYVELTVNQSNTGAAAFGTNTSSQFSSAFQLEFVRDL